MTRFTLDAGVQRFGGVVIGGSPLRLFRVTTAGEDLIDRLAAGDDIVDDSRVIDALLDAGAIHPAVDQSPFGPDDVTIVTPVHETSDRGLRYGSGTIVVDDASPSKVPDATIRFERNRGPGAARNAGLALVETPLVAFVDDDVELGDGWLTPLLGHFADPRVGLVAPRVITPDDGSPVARYELTDSPLDLGDAPARIRAGSRVSYVPAAALVCRTDAARSIGGFDEALRFGEDVDFVWRLDAAGWRCRFEPASRVNHPARPGWAAWIMQRVTYGSSTAPLARRHGRALAPVRMSGWSVAAWTIAVFVRPPVGVLAAAGMSAGTGVALVRKLPDVPPSVSFRLAWLGNLAAGAQLANATRRVWWPVLLVAAIRSRSARRALLLSMLAARHPLRLADDLAFSVGVWRGMLHERTLAPFVPAITSWPGKSVT
jgi:mycofactocin system glycosyltransferase